ncbi:MAG: 3'-5' exonuclease [Legionellales bacterium]|nr:3'-5' exonuclease [Legionellales bacterium]|tara:strand:- start:1632 stop:2411 length:780 start_codon:yes stop_codon:yes gene_type:complete
MTTLVFDIETVPDASKGRLLYNGAENLNDADVGQMLLAQQRAKNLSEFLPHYLHQVVAISVLLFDGGNVRVWSIGEETDDEKSLIERFWRGLEKYQPTLVSWNGSGFDLPVLHYRSLFHKIQAPLYWEMGEKDNSYKWNNYLNRYHLRHCDVMDMLSGYQSRAFAGLDAVATLCGLPGKQGMSGKAVYDHFLQQDLRSIRHYCETDVLNTYLVYLRFEWMRGRINEIQFSKQLELVKNTGHDKPHLQEFIDSISEEYFV